MIGSTDVVELPQEVFGRESKIFCIRSYGVFMSKHKYKKAFRRWLYSWLIVCFIISFFAGGINCKCPEPPEDEGTVYDANNTENNQKDCYCVAPGTPCGKDSDCRTKILYCIELFCRNGTCIESPEIPPKEVVPEREPTEPPPQCPSSCQSDTDCKEEICGDYNLCKSNICQKNDIVIP